MTVVSFESIQGSSLVVLVKKRASGQKDDDDGWDDLGAKES
jgi:hypothetical protein